MPTFPPTRWAETGDVETPNDDYVANGFQDDVPVPAAYLNWALSHVVAEWAKIGVLTIDELGNISTTGDLTVDDIVADTVAVGGGYGSTGTTLASNGNISSNGNLVVDGSGTFGGGYGTSGSTLAANGDASFDGNVVIDGQLTHGAAQNYFTTCAVDVPLRLDPAYAAASYLLANTDYDYPQLADNTQDLRIEEVTIAGVDFTYTRANANFTNPRCVVWDVPVPVGATPDGLFVRLLTPSGGNATGNVGVYLIRSETTISGGTVQTGFQSTVTTPAAGAATVALDNPALGISTLSASWRLFLIISGTASHADSTGFVNAYVRWSFTQPGAF